jgi:hypothetical protein
MVRFHHFSADFPLFLLPDIQNGAIWCGFPTFSVDFPIFFPLFRMEQYGAFSPLFLADFPLSLLPVI